MLISFFLLMLTTLNLVFYYSSFRDALKISDRILVRLIYWTYHTYHIDCIYHSWEGIHSPMQFLWLNSNLFVLLFSPLIFPDIFRKNMLFPLFILCVFFVYLTAYVLFLRDNHILNEQHCLFHWWMSVRLVWLFPLFTQMSQNALTDYINPKERVLLHNVKIHHKRVSRHVWWHFTFSILEWWKQNLVVLWAAKRWSLL